MAGWLWSVINNGVMEFEGTTFCYCAYLQLVPTGKGPAELSWGFNKPADLDSQPCATETGGGFTGGQIRLGQHFYWTNVEE